MKVLITGGAGYIGSHVAFWLLDQGIEVAIIDNLSGGHKHIAKNFLFFKGDIGDVKFVGKVLDEYKPDAVLHFAGFIQVSESVKKPVKYYHNNFVKTLLFVNELVKRKINKFIFSSTAAVYGNVTKVPISEDVPPSPINPYGKSKLFVENVLHDLHSQGLIDFVILRYFNAAGADPKGRTGEMHNPETHLIPLVLKTAKGERDKILIYGTDYDTPDGTAVRDYIHVTDLAEIHAMALYHLLDKGESIVLNCGYGRGYSVREVIETAKKVTGIDFRVEEASRREGDSPILVADVTKLKSYFKWIPRYNDLEFIIKTAWEWEKKI